jgi:hypothetical protein
MRCRFNDFIADVSEFDIIRLHSNKKSRRKSLEWQHGANDSKTTKNGII